MFLSGFLIIIIASVHVFAHKITILDELPRKKWLSFAGGISVALVFVHILPELHRMQDSIEHHSLLPGSVEHDLYMIVLAGILLFYGLEHMAIAVQTGNASDKKTVIEDNIFWFHIGAFALFNCIVGYYLHGEMDKNGFSTIMTFAAAGFHFLVNDHALLQHHEKQYHSIGRWIMAAAVLVGWCISVLLEIPEIIYSVLFALFSGAIIVNSLKEELPKEKDSKVVFFLIGAISYSILILF